MDLRFGTFILFGSNGMQTCDYGVKNYLVPGFIGTRSRDPYFLTKIIVLGLNKKLRVFRFLRCAFLPAIKMNKYWRDNN